MAHVDVSISWQNEEVERGVCPIYEYESQSLKQISDSSWFTVDGVGTAGHCNMRKSSMDIKMKTSIYITKIHLIKLPLYSPSRQTLANQTLLLRPRVPTQEEASLSLCDAIG